MKSSVVRVPIDLPQISLSYGPTIRISNRPLFTRSSEAYHFLIKSWNPHTINMVEEFKIVLLNRANRMLGICPISSGGVSGTVADPRLILGVAVTALACGIILAHNHPSGNMRPSTSDEQITRKIASAAQVHDIRLVDHLVLSSEGYFSFADEGLL